MRNQITHQQYDEERALYALKQTDVVACIFEGEADGESALKESHGIHAHNCRFALRYPFWHAEDCLLADCHLTETARAPLWYTRLATIRHCRLFSPKALRECDDTLIEQSVISSEEFGWKCRKIVIRSSSVDSSYFLFDCERAELQQVNFKGKYSFQYLKDSTIENCTLDTKDAFWHSKNVTVTDSTIRGEYLGWFSENLTLINCHIVGTQPLCYCKNLRLINCTMEDADLAFEYSQVEADIKGHVLSVKNPVSGSICADSIGEIIWENSVKETSCQVLCRTPISE